MDLNAVRGHVELLQYAKAKQAELKDIEERSRAAVEEALGSDEIGELDGKIVVTYRHIKQRRFSQSKHKADQPGCHEIYMTPTESRQFRVEE
jgi:fructose-specific phosphotransferase system component IIB